jgi:hypothetical protein
MMPLVVPLGQFFGTFHSAGSHVRNVRVGGDVHQLDDPAFGVWALMHGMPDQLPDRPWTRTAVAEAAGTEVDRLVDSLLAVGLAVEVDPADGPGFARAHRMGHRMLGLGNSAAPWLYSIGLFGQPVVQVTREVFDLWDACQLAGSLWEACEAVAPDAPVDLATGFLGTVHHLLAMSVVYLEPVA